MKKFITLEEFFELYNSDMLSSFSWYITGNEITDIGYNELTIRFRNVHDNNYCELKGDDLVSFRKWILNEVDKCKLLSNNCGKFGRATETKIHFYIRKFVKTDGDIFKISENGEPYRHIPADEVDMSILYRWISGVGNWRNGFSEWKIFKKYVIYAHKEDNNWSFENEHSYSLSEIPNRIGPSIIFDSGSEDAARVMCKGKLYFTPENLNDNNPEEDIYLEEE